MYQMSLQGSVRLLMNDVVHKIMRMFSHYEVVSVSDINCVLCLSFIYLGYKDGAHLQCLSGTEVLSELF